MASEPRDGEQHKWFSDYDAGRTDLIESSGVLYQCRSLRRP